MTGLLIGWLAAAIAMLFLCVGKARDGGALVLSYFLALSLIHVPGALAFLPFAAPIGGGVETGVGFELALTAAIAFVAGAAICQMTQRQHAAAPSFGFAKNISTWAIGIGFVAYFVAMPIAARFSSATSIVSPLGELLIVGLWLRLVEAERARDVGLYAQVWMMLPLLPLATLTLGGFAGFGISWVFSVIAFAFVRSKHRWAYVAAAPIVLFFGLSLFVAYMSERTAIRDAVWTQQSGLSERFDRVQRVIDALEPIDLTKVSHVEAIDSRLNQNYLVGVGVLRHRDGVTDLLHGSSIQLWALVPRAIWPDKPVVGGGGQLVSEFTGVMFPEGTSVGVGNVLEAYMNFGMAGVMVVMAALGWALRALDFGIARAVETGDLGALLRVALPGIMLLQPGGNFLEILTAAAAAYIAALLAERAARWTNLIGETNPSMVSTMPRSRLGDLP
jgi:hypothetical protein